MAERLAGPGPFLRDIVGSTFGPRVTTENTPRGYQCTLARTVNLNRFHRIRGTAWVVPTARGKPGGNAPLIEANDGRDPAGDRCHRSRLFALANALSRSSASSSDGRPAAPGYTRMTRADPGSRLLSRSRMRCRSCRRTLLRWTALPTVLGTTKPTRAESQSAMSALSGDRR